MRNGSIASVTEAGQAIHGSGAGGDGGDGFRRRATTQQQAAGDYAWNQSDTALVDGSECTAVNQGDAATAVSFVPVWWRAGRAVRRAPVRAPWGCASWGGKRLCGGTPAPPRRRSSGSARS
ncbi:hypothetical protein [Streptomyces sp. NPDC092370]|uniref:hypothetical protein n=1 Tax=Streptomyces sp. NPDC092370 TaxID=3366016 RepID=UPI00382DD45C